MLNRETSLRYFTSRYVFMLYVVENMGIMITITFIYYVVFFNLDGLEF